MSGSMPCFSIAKPPHPHIHKSSFHSQLHLTQQAMFGHSLTSTWANAFAGRARSFGVWVTLESLCAAGVFAMYGRPMLQTARVRATERLAGPPSRSF
ncbi:hypothetical protein BD626DRAFT_497736 [Schizophyllum amplum]|uniref:Uncharacterized protein n=1 Tax=Schizophyllum amplum TaxID=97359 RepID=A0A550CCN2_9AGAR|nr:hypothetical protein BD626DRAFT_497736 [Auriculariopsis ampla]